MTVKVAEARTCSNCGTALSIDGESQGLCPVCLQKTNLDPSSSGFQSFSWVCDWISERRRA